MNSLDTIPRSVGTKDSGTVKSCPSHGLATEAPYDHIHTSPFQILYKKIL